MDDSNTFQDLIDFFLRNLLSQLHIFPYSPLKEERNLFHLLFQPGAFSGASLNDLVSSEELNPIIQALRQETGVTEDAAREVFSTLFVFVHGYASLLANNEMKLEEDQLTLSLKKVFFGAIYAEKEIENEGNI